jgi:hypothetical protein
VLKIAAAVLAFFCLALSSTRVSAQILPRGNVYAGVSYGAFTDVINRQSYRGWNGSGEWLPFGRLPHIGFVLDASGYYRTGVVTYNGLFGPRYSFTYGKWRPFAHAMAGIQHIRSFGDIYNPIAIDVGGGADYKLFFKNFSWRIQGDYMRTHYLSAHQSDFRASTGLVWRF